MTKPAKTIFQSAIYQDNLKTEQTNALYKASEEIDQAFQSHNYESLISTISKIPLHILSHSTNLHTRIINSFEEPQHKLEIFQALSKALTKPINEVVIPYEEIKEIQELNFFALTKFYHAQAIVEKHSYKQKEHLGDILTLLTDANIIIQNNGLKLNFISGPVTLEITPDTIICDLIESYGASEAKQSKEQAFTFAEDSLKQQQAKLAQYHPSILKLLLTTAKMKYDFDLDVARNTASQIDDSTPVAKAIKLSETLKYAKEASDMASRLDDADSKMDAILLAVEICDFYGNTRLANLYCQQMLGQAKQTKRKLSEDYHGQWEGKYDSPENKKPKENNHAKEEMTDIITELLKAEIFDKITEIMKSGTWNEEKEKQLINLVSDEYLTNSQALLGFFSEKKPSDINYVLNIVRTLAYKTLAEEIVKQKSTNKALPENNPEYVLDIPTITKGEFEESKPNEKNPYTLIMARMDKLEAFIGLSTTSTLDEKFLQGAPQTLTEDDFNAMFSSSIAG